MSHCRYLATKLNSQSVHCSGILPSTETTSTTADQLRIGGSEGVSPQTTTSAKPKDSSKNDQLTTRDRNSRYSLQNLNTTNQNSTDNKLQSADAKQSSDNDKETVINNDGMLKIAEIPEEEKEQVVQATVVAATAGGGTGFFISAFTLQLIQAIVNRIAGDALLGGVVVEDPDKLWVVYDLLMRSGLRSFIPNLSRDHESNQHDVIDTSLYVSLYEKAISQNLIYTQEEFIEQAETSAYVQSLFQKFLNDVVSESGGSGVEKLLKQMNHAGGLMQIGSSGSGLGKDDIQSSKENLKLLYFLHTTPTRK